jgi:tetratricopeptide (TPR) repeat protein
MTYHQALRGSMADHRALKGISAAGTPADRATDARKLVELEPSNPAHRVTLVQALLANEEFAEARAAYSEAMQAGSAGYNERAEFGKAFQTAGQWPDAAAAFASALAISEGLSAVEMGALCMFHGLALAKSGEHESARAAFHRAIQAANGDLSTLKFLGRVLKASREPEGAALFLERAAALGDVEAAAMLAGMRRTSV